MATAVGMNNGLRGPALICRAPTITCTVQTQNFEYLNIVYVNEFYFKHFYRNF